VLKNKEVVFVQKGQDFYKENAKFSIIIQHAKEEKNYQVDVFAQMD